MTDELVGGADPSGEAQLSDNAPTKTPAVGRDDLAAFAAAQRQLAAVDFTHLAIAKRAIEQATAIRSTNIFAAHDAVVKSFARSFDFSGIAAAHKSIIDAGVLKATVAPRDAMGGLAK